MQVRRVTKRTLEAEVARARARLLTLRCNFCGKIRSAVHRLVVGPCGNICDECVRVCLATIQEDDARDAGLPEDYTPAEKAAIKKAEREIDAHLRRKRKVKK